MHKSTLRMVLGSAVALAGLWATEPSARAQQTRFDVQNFRPTPGPRDLVIVPQSQPLAHLSGALGAYFSFALDPLVLLNSDGNRSLDVVKNRFQLDLMGAMGLGGWFELGVVLPVILYQSSGNLEPLGTEGEVRSTVIGDLSLIGKLPFVRRQSYASGFGVALMTRVNAPTGVQEAFASDGTWTVNPTLVTDYRFGMGALISLQAGMNIRPTSEFFDVKLGPTFTGAGGAEMPLVRRWGLTMLGGVYFNVPLTKIPDSIRQIPAEAMLGLRLYSNIGVTFTTGFNFGADCGFAVPSFRYFLAAVWVPGKTREYEAIENFKRPPDDPDGDGLIGETDHCPLVKGPVENHGCPELDTDKDGILDRVDECPDLPGMKAYNGCPRVFRNDTQIKIMERVQFATDQAEILPESRGLLEEVAQFIAAHKELLLIRIDGHTDSRASDEYNLELSQRRVNSVRQALIQRGIDPTRLEAKGFGKSMQLMPEQGTNEGAMALNRRVEFTILKVAPSGEAGNAATAGPGSSPTSMQGPAPEAGASPTLETLPMAPMPTTPKPAVTPKAVSKQPAKTQTTTGAPGGKK